MPGGSHDFGSKVTAGQTYTIVETGAPTGYAYTANIVFTVNKDGTVDTKADKSSDGTIQIRDKAISFTIDKIDVTSSKEISGAVMTVYEKAADGKLTKVDSWTSVAGTTHDFGSKLTAGTTYVLREETAPDGYTAISDTEFIWAKPYGSSCEA